MAQSFVQVDLSVQIHIYEVPFIQARSNYMYLTITLILLLSDTDTG